MCCESTSTAVPGVRAADLGRRLHALVLVGRRHAHVDDREVGLVLGDDGQQRLGVADARDDLVAGVLEQPREPLAQEHGVLRDHDVAWERDLDARAAAGRAGDRERAAVRGDAVAEAGEAGAAARTRAADAVVGDAHAQRAVLARARVERDRASADACLTAFVSASQTTK